MPFEPANTNLNTLDEFKNLSHTIRYYGYVGSAVTYYPVTIMALDENSTINVDGDTISGYYSDAFDSTIHYRNKDDTFTTVDKFKDINTDTLYGIHHYDADENRTKVYSYLAQANADEKLYTITVTNNWTNGRNQLLKYSNPSAYESITCSWLNTSTTSITWTNSNGEPIVWENNTWL